MREVENRIANVLVLLFCSFITSYSQTIVKGVIRDATTQQPLQSVSVYFKGGKGIASGSDGRYMLTTGNTKFSLIQFSYVGYKTVIKTIVPDKEQVIDIDLIRSETKNNVTVKTNKRGKYSNRNNPAVDLIRRVIDNKSKNRITAYDYFSYEQYEKMELSLSNTPKKLMNNRLFKNFKFVFENQDTTKFEGRAVLPFYLEEKISQKFYRNNPEKNKTYILGDKKVNFGEYIDVGGISAYLNRLYEDVDVYQNNISLLSNQFLSPIADMAPSFYRFYIADTVVRDSTKLVRLNFTPKNLNDLLFRGTIFITLDGNYSVQRINMGISKHSNLNFVRQLEVTQDFEKGPDGRYHVTGTNTLVEFSLTKGSKGGIVGERSVSLNKFTINQPLPDSVFTGPSVVTVGSPEKNSDSFWIQHRQPALTEIESKVYTNIDSLQNMTSYKRFMDIATLFLAGYKGFGPYEVGPVNAFYSFNPVEGFRLRLGGRTTPKLSQSIYFENYVAYGFKDVKLKYFLSGTYSFNHKSIYSYPLNYLKLSYQYDTKIPGQELQFVQEDNFLLSFKRGKNDKWLYNNILKAEYVREFGKSFSYTFGLKNWKQTPAGIISYLKPDGAGFKTITDLTTTELSAQLRWSPHQQFYQGKVFRIPIINKYPIFNLRYAAGIKGFMRGEYSYHNLNVTMNKRFYLSQLGFSDMLLEGGYIFGKIPYPLLTLHRANQTYSYQINSYNMMNFLEFVSDRYAAINLDHYFNGFIFNKIPLLKKLKLREVITAKILYGGVRVENNPDINFNTFKFPVDKESGLSTTYTLNSGPYIEASAGIMNIFKLIRVDIVKRFTYLNHPQVTELGIRTRVKMDF